MTGFCRSVSLDEIREHGHVLSPGHYVGSADISEEQQRNRVQGCVDELTREFLKLLDAAYRTEVDTEASWSVTVRLVRRWLCRARIRKPVRARG